MIKTHYVKSNNERRSLCGVLPWYPLTSLAEVTCNNCKRTKAYKEACARASGK